MSKIVELNALEVAEVTGGGIVAWLEQVFGEDPPETNDWHWFGTKG